jgi:hypothetical protein
LDRFAQLVGRLLLDQVALEELRLEIRTRLELAAWGKSYHHLPMSRALVQIARVAV